MRLAGFCHETRQKQGFRPKKCVYEIFKDICGYILWNREELEVSEVAAKAAASEAQGKCTKLSALSAAMNVKYHSSQLRANRFSAKSASRKRAKDISLVESL